MSDHRQGRWILCGPYLPDPGVDDTDVRLFGDILDGHRLDINIHVVAQACGIESHRHLGCYALYPRLYLRTRGVDYHYACGAQTLCAVVLREISEHLVVDPAPGLILAIPFHRLMQQGLNGGILAFLPLLFHIDVGHHINMVLTIGYLYIECRARRISLGG